MGNPPFNDKNESPIYNIFIEYSLKICKKIYYLLFLHDGFLVEKD